MKTKKIGSSRYNRNSKRKEIEMLLNELNEELENNYQENGFFFLIMKNPRINSYNN